MNAITSLLFTSLHLMTSVSSQVFLPNVDCGPHIDYIKTDEGLHRYTPFVVKLHRCHGSNVGPNPQNKKCLVEENGANELDVHAITLATGAFTTIKLLNHTKCKEQCLLNQSSCTPYQKFTNHMDCSCKCNYKTAPVPNPCSKPFFWDQSKCNCGCQHTTLTCPQRKEFSAETCGCVCKQKFNLRCAKRKQILKEDDCTCMNPPVVTGAARRGCDNGVSGVLLAVIMIGEAFFIVMCYLLFYVYCFKRVYLTKKEAKYNMNQSHGNGVRSMQYYDVQAAEVTPDDVVETPLDAEKRSYDENSEHSNGGLLYTSQEYYPEEQKSPVADTQEWYLYNEDLDDSSETPLSEVPSNKERRAPPSYSDCMSERSEDGYTSVTQV